MIGYLKVDAEINSGETNTPITVIMLGLTVLSKSGIVSAQIDHSIARATIALEPEQGVIESLQAFGWTHSGKDWSYANDHRS